MMETKPLPELSPAFTAERFISMVKRDTFDYTEWQRNLWETQSIGVYPCFYYTDRLP